MKLLNSLVLSISTCLFVAPVVFGEPKEPPQRHPPGHTPLMGMRGHGASSNSLVRGSGGFWLERKVTNPDFMKKVGITEEQSLKLREAWKVIEAESSKLEEEICLLARQQAEHLKKALAEEGSDTSAIMEVIEKIGKLRIEQAKLAMKRVLLIRDQLTPAQRNLLTQTVDEDQKKWRAGREESQRAKEIKPEKQNPPNKNMNAP